MSLINCKINLILTLSANYCIINHSFDNMKLTFASTDIQIYAPVVTLSTQDNAKLLQQLKSGFKRAINWNKYQSKVTIPERNRHLSKFSRSK